MAIAESIVGVAGTVLNKFVADKDLKAKLEHELKTAFHSANLAQIGLNKQEAAHKSTGSYTHLTLPTRLPV